ncbi:hypothetical protein DSL64_20740 [Dyadobacter luteus]|uniref:DinB-like domain-containing protein n=1 Tax=Dyadobacter luteus TaxID=2259619 RepID=A0A3D8Y6Q3_9BACT|nr:DinB family protein [Dyadobacter luteus]REA58516.1 hypothetical protein DSL64_20740 [Dyadobacter luteus]
MTDRKFPIGPFVLKHTYTREELENIILSISSAPSEYRQLVANLQEETLLKGYREGSWNIRQLIHHVADIALLHYFRMKKVITEPGSDMALINMDAWASTTDSLHGPVEDSLTMFESITKRYVILINSLSEDEKALTYFHPVRQILLDQRQATAMSAWHVWHHLAHIRLAIED